MNPEETNTTATQGRVKVLRKIVNLTQHTATSEQVAAGVVDFAKDERRILQTLLTFDELPNSIEIKAAAEDIVALCAMMYPDADTAMIGGAPFLMSALEDALSYCDIQPLYAFSERVVIKEKMSNGVVRKTNVFRHIGFVEV